VSEIKILKEKVNLFKDLVMFLGGMAGIAFQQYLSSQGQKPNLLFLGIFTLMTGVPGATNLIGLFRSQQRIESLQSSSAPSEYPSELGSSSQNV
jgi:uncharacterized membrane protein